MKDRPPNETKRMLASGHESWREWMLKLITALTDRGTMSFGDVFAWGRQRGKTQDWCRHLLAYSDDRITLIPGKLWCLTTRAKGLMGEKETACLKRHDGPSLARLAEKLQGCPDDQSAEGVGT